MEDSIMDEKIVQEVGKTLCSILKILVDKKRKEISTNKRETWENAIEIVTEAFRGYQSLGEETTTEKEEESDNETHREGLDDDTGVSYRQGFAEKERYKRFIKWENLSDEEAKILYEEVLDDEAITEKAKDEKRAQPGTFFEELLDNLIKMTQEVLASKAEEYTSDGDRFYNFRQAAIMDSTTPKKSLWGMMLKQLVCVRGMVNNTPEKPSVEYIDELDRGY